MLSMAARPPWRKARMPLVTSVRHDQRGKRLIGRQDQARPGDHHHRHGEPDRALHHAGEKRDAGRHGQKERIEAPPPCPSLPAPFVLAPQFRCDAIARRPDELELILRCNCKTVSQCDRRRADFMAHDGADMPNSARLSNVLALADAALPQVETAVADATASCAPRSTPRARFPARRWNSTSSLPMPCPGLRPMPKR